LFVRFVGMKYEVKTEHGTLAYSSMVELQKLYEQGFIEPQDLVRHDGGTKWVPAGQMAQLRGAEARSKTETRMGIFLAMAIGASIVVGAAALKYKGLALTGLVLMAVGAAFLAYRRR
jgi:hypothetical protein